MSDAAEPDPSRWKVFPRNLTAHAARLVPGNPMSSRPDSGVDNAFPGLEVDQRNLEQKFFPGLSFEFHHPSGAIVTGIAPTPMQAQHDLRETDSPPHRRLYLWALYGCLPPDSRPALVSFLGQSGMEVWRRIRELPPGRVAILIGPGPLRPSIDPRSTLRMVTKELTEAYGQGSDVSPICVVQRDAPGLVRAVLAQDRTRYLDEDGVIDVDAYAPGELTKTMCAPWMYDFRDCYCFYWASNKPDLVDGADGRSPYLNFIRRDRASTTPDTTVWTGRSTNIELRDYDMVNGMWHDLPVVLNDRETPGESLPTWPPTENPMTRSEAAAELRYLATVEHALVVEYLFAYYSLKTSRRPPDSSATDVERNVFFAGDQVFQIAIDEMRHFLWANELLRVLGETVPSLGRAAVIGQPPTKRSGRKIYPKGQKTYLNRRFALRRLDPETLGWFLAVEQPSQITSAGMYVELLDSVRDCDDFAPERHRLLPLIKLLIDEGAGHYRRFLAVQDALAGLDPSQYLQSYENDSLRDPGSSDDHDRYLRLCNHYYASILETLHISFCLGEGSGSELVHMAIRSMQNLDDVARWLANNGVAPRMSPPRRTPRPCPDADGALAILRGRERAIRTELDGMTNSADPATRHAAGEHLQFVAAHFEQVRHRVRSRQQGSPS